MTSPPPVLPELPKRYRPWPSPERALLGQGGAATVWRVQDQDLGVLVALKVLKTTNSRMVARLEREAILASRVVHPNVVPLHDIGRTPDGQSYLAFGLASDGTLLDLSGDPPPWPILCRMLKQTLSALGALHARGILHLDVKMSNLLLHRSGPHISVWLADLGVARALFDESEENRIFGTVSYMPAERLRGHYHLWGPSADLFSLGVMVYRLITGELPFPALGPREALGQRKEPPTIIKPRHGYALPHGISEVILPLLAYHHADRFDLAADVIRALDSLPPLTVRPTLSGEPILDPGPNAPKDAPPWPRPRISPPPQSLPSHTVSRRIPQAPSLLVHREIRVVQRSKEQEDLWKVCQETMTRRRPQLVELTGPRGVGRSRLANDLLTRLEEEGWAEGVRMDFGAGGGPGLGLIGCWKRLLPAGAKPEKRVGEVARFIARNRRQSAESCEPDARALLAWLEPGVDTLPTDSRIARSLLVEHLVARSWRGMAWLCLEDLHLAPENDACWAVLDAVLTAKAPILVLSTTAAGHNSPSILELRLRNPEDQHRISIHPLEPSAAAGLVQALLSLDRNLERRLVQYTNGTPGRIRDIVLHWVNAGALHESQDPGEGKRIWSLRDPLQFPRNERHFAEMRLEHLTKPSRAYSALSVIALAGNGCPKDVIARIDEEGLDRLRVEGLVELRGSSIHLVPPELVQVVCEQIDEQQAIAIHGQLAESWAVEGDGFHTQAKVGRHRYHQGALKQALPPLFRALHLGRDRMPVGQAIEIATLTYRAAEAHGDRTSQAWQLAGMVMAQSHWRQGKTARARHIDEVLSTQPIHARLSLRIWSDRLLRSRLTDPRLPDAFERIEASLSDLSLPERARVLVARAQLRMGLLDRRGTHADLLNALACRPHPAVECHAHLLRVRLLDAIAPMSAWHEALRCIEMARGHGLLGPEVLAWGLAGLHMARLGHGEEAIVRVEAGIERLEVHGDIRLAAEARLHLGRIYAELGQHDDAIDTWSQNMDLLPGKATIALRGRELIALHATIRGKYDLADRLASPDMPTPAIRQTWSLIRACVSLSQGTLPMLPGPDDLDLTAAVGRYGIAIGLHLANALKESGQPGLAQFVYSRIEQSCNDRFLSIETIETWLQNTQA